MLNFQNEKELIQQRSKFLESLTSKKLSGSNLIKKIAIEDNLFYLLRSACFNYVLSCLIHNNIEFDLDPSFDVFIEKNANKISKMVNVTPNGVIRPKHETILEFNLIQKVLCLVLMDLDLLSATSKIRAPISIRIVTSDDDAAILERPRANNKLHSDFWTGAVCDFAILIPIFGTIENIDVVFCEPRGITPEYLKEYPNYTDGLSTIEGYEEYSTVMTKGDLFLQDIFCLHGTRRKGRGARISIDFTFQSNQYDSIIKPYYSTKALDNDNHITTKDWCNLSLTNLFFETESIQDLLKKNEYSKNSLAEFPGSAIKLQTSQTAKILDLTTASELTMFAAKD